MTGRLRGETATVTALRHLGQGVLAHPANRRLRRQLQDDPATLHTFYRQLIVVLCRAILLPVTRAATVSRLIATELEHCRIADADLEDLLGCLPCFEDFAAAYE